MKTQGQISIFRPNDKGTGCAVKIELHPAHGETDGCVLIRFAPQKTAGEINDVERENRTLPAYDWANAIAAKLSLFEISEVLQVFCGCQESLADGKGLYIRSATALLVFRMEHRIEPCCGYLLEARRKATGINETQTTRIFLTVTEAFALRLALESSMGRMAFGD